MSDEDRHPAVEFHYMTAEGKAAYNPSTEKDPEEHWFFNREKAGSHFSFVVHDRHDKRGLQIYAKDFRGLARFEREQEYEYIEEPPKRVQEFVSETVEFWKEPLVIGEMERLCPNCGSRYCVDVMPKVDMLFDGQPVQRYFKETCPECSEELVEVKTQDIKREGDYPKEPGDLDEDALWEYSRRTP